PAKTPCRSHVPFLLPISHVRSSLHSTQSSNRFVPNQQAELPARANESCPQKISSNHSPQSHSTLSPRRPACTARAWDRCLLLHETRGKNHPAIFFRSFFLESAYPHPAKSIRSLRNSRPDAARKFLPFALRTKAAPKSPCPPNRATFSQACHSMSQT